MVEHWLLVTASREWRDRQRMRTSFLSVQQRFDVRATAMGIVHGATRGGDQTADEVAAELGWARDLSRALVRNGLATADPLGIGATRA
jgi:hypothetical protein